MKKAGSTTSSLQQTRNQAKSKEGMCWFPAEHFRSLQNASLAINRGGRMCSRKSYSYLFVGD